jgi:PiT family inorganic phosphate transporter
MLTLVIIIVVIALVFDFLNGMNDAANSIATIVSTKVLSPFAAVVWAAFFNFAAAFIFGHHVAETIGKGIVEPSVVDAYLILATLLGSIFWVYTCTHFGLPISVSHALIGGLIGPALIKVGPSAIFASGVIKVSAFIILSPLIGMILGYLLMVLALWIFRKTSPYKVDSISRVLQLVSSAVFSLGHGSNDAQKTMGIIAVLLYSTGYMEGGFHIPLWVVLAAYTAISLGTLTGGWKVIKTLGVGLTDLKPVGGLCAEISGAITVIGSTLGGIPVSTTHTITGSIIGTGITKRFSAVRWGVAKNVVFAWVFTIPSSMVISMFFYWIISFFIN